MSMAGFGLEVSLDVETAALAVARAGDDGGWQADLAFYGDPWAAAAEAGRLYQDLEDNVGLFLDAMPCAPLLAPLRDAGVWLHLMEAVDVAAASGEFKALVKAHRVRALAHPALLAAVRAAAPRSLLSSFAFERRRVSADMSPLNAASFAVWGLRRNESMSQPSAWVVGGEQDQAAAAASVEQRLELAAQQGNLTAYWGDFSSFGGTAPAEALPPVSHDSTTIGITDGRYDLGGST